MSDDNRYHYFVSCMYDDGNEPVFYMVEFLLDEPITKYEQVLNIAVTLSRDWAHKVVILNYVLLSRPKEV